MKRRSRQKQNKNHRSRGQHVHEITQYKSAWVNNWFQHCTDQGTEVFIKSKKKFIIKKAFDLFHM